MGSIARARLPRWCLPVGWPSAEGRSNAAPALAHVVLDGPRIAALHPTDAVAPGAWDLAGTPVLPGLLDAHTHIDKTFTINRLGAVEPGLLSAIDAMMQDKLAWTADDIRARATQALDWAFDAGVVHLRTHVDWWEPERPPLAWRVLGELAQAWAGRIRVERVSLSPLHLYADGGQAMSLAAKVAAGGADARLGGFVHSTHWDLRALRHLLVAAQEHDLDVDLHVDEELEASACGLAETARLLREVDFQGRVVCGHACALAVQGDDIALRTLDAVARAPITLVSLPITNLLLQDAVTGRTPRLRGITLLKEARERGIPLLVASDNVQDAFCPVGSYDPLEALSAGVLVGQLGDAFDVWTETLCRTDWLSRNAASRFDLVGRSADLVVFGSARVEGFPSRTQPRIVVRGGRAITGIDR